MEDAPALLAARSRAGPSSRSPSVPGAASAAASAAASSLLPRLLPTSPRFDGGLHPSRTARTSARPWARRQTTRATICLQQLATYSTSRALASKKAPSPSGSPPSAFAPLPLPSPDEASVATVPASSARPYAVRVR